MGHIFWNERIKLIDSGEMVDVLAIGDSWFHYPFNNLITPLHAALARPTIYVIGENGARADELSTGSWLASFRAMLDRLSDHPARRDQRRRQRLRRHRRPRRQGPGRRLQRRGDRRRVLPARAARRRLRRRRQCLSRAAVRGGRRAPGGDRARAQLRLRDSRRPHAAGIAQLAQAADGQLPRSGRRGADGRRAARHRARAHRSLHALSRRPRDGAGGTRCAGGRSRLVGGNACRFGMGQRTASAAQRVWQARRRLLERSGAACAGTVVIARNLAARSGHEIGDLVVDAPVVAFLDEKNFADELAAGRLAADLEHGLAAAAETAIYTTRVCSSLTRACAWWRGQVVGQLALKRTRMTFLSYSASTWFVISNPPGGVHAAPAAAADVALVLAGSHFRMLAAQAPTFGENSITVSVRCPPDSETQT